MRALPSSCPEPPSAPAGSEAALLHCFVLVKKSGRKLVPHPICPSFPVSTEPIPTERAGVLSSLKCPRGLGTASTPFSGLDTRSHCCWKGRVPPGCGSRGWAQDPKGLLCGRRLALPPGAHSAQPPAPRVLVTSGGYPSALTP